MSCNCSFTGHLVAYRTTNHLMKLFWMNMTGEPERYMLTYLQLRKNCFNNNQNLLKQLFCLKITIKHKMNYAASPFWMFFL